MSRNAILTVLLGVIATVAMMVALGGCSGGGASSATVSGASVKAVATDQFTGALLLKHWLIFLYRDQGGTGILPLPPATIHPASVRPSAVRPASARPGRPGLVRPAQDEPITNSDGSVATYHWNDDYSGYGHIVWPDGTFKDIVWTPYIALPNDVDWEVDFDETWSDGTKFHYHWQSNYFGRIDDNELSNGTITLSGGTTGTWSADRSDIRDILQATFSDGTGLTLQVPVRIVVPPGAALGYRWAPDCATGATGSIQGATGVHSFALAGQNPDGAAGPGVWTTLAIAPPGSSTPDDVFTLGVGFTGSGNLSGGGQLLGNLSWNVNPDGTFDGELRQVGTAAAAVSPGDAARRLAVERFIYSAATEMYQNYGW